MGEDLFGLSLSGDQQFTLDSSGNLGTSYGLTAPGNYTASTGYLNDYREAVKLDPYVMRAGTGDTRPWWERVAEYGLTRAIDANFGPPAINKGQAAGTFAGQNGRTYVQNPGQARAGAGGDVGGVPVWLLLLGAAVALFA